MSLLGERGNVLLPVRLSHKVDHDRNALAVRDPVDLGGKVLRLVVDAVRRAVLLDELDLVVCSSGRDDESPAQKMSSKLEETGRTYLVNVLASWIAASPTPDAPA